MICVALNYYPVRFQSGESPRFAYYAYGRDYHDVMRDKLRQLAVFVSSYSGDTGRVCCDTAPVRERYWAVRAGLGFIGKNAQLIIPGKGSFFFLGELITSLDLPPDSPVVARCGDWFSLYRQLSHRCVVRSGECGCPSVHLLSNHREQGGYSSFRSR